MNPWVLLIIAVVAEVIGSNGLKASKGFTVLGPSVLVVAGYGVAFWLMSLALKAGLQLGLAYAVWSGLGTALIAISGVLIFKETFGTAGVVGIGLIIVGVVLLNLSGAKP
jgi:small multidrug resistance pump